MTSSGSTTLNIVDTDNPNVTVNYRRSSYTVTEGSSTTVYIDTSEDPLRSITIPLTRRNNGASNSDYSVSTSTVTLSSSQRSASFTFTATDDSHDDDGESVNFAFDLNRLPDGVSAGQTATVYITDNDDSDIPETLSTSPSSPVSGTAITASVSGGNQILSGPAYVWRISGARVATGATYTPPHSEAGNTLKVTATYTDTFSSKSLTITVGTIASGAESITVSFSTSSFDLTEGSQRLIYVNLTEAPGRTITIPFTFTRNNGCSTSDYRIPNSVTFGPDDTQEQMLVLTTQDTDDDDGESVTINFGNLPTLVTSSGNTVLNIIDDDDPTLTVHYRSSSYNVTEGSSTTVYIDTSEDPLRSITIPLTRSNNRASDSDYSVSTSTVTLSSSRRSASFTFTATDDSYDDDGESVNFAFDLNRLPDGVSAGQTSTVYITDNDDSDIPETLSTSPSSPVSGTAITASVTGGNPITSGPAYRWYVDGTLAHTLASYTPLHREAGKTLSVTTTYTDSFSSKTLTLTVGTIAAGAPTRHRLLLQLFLRRHRRQQHQHLRQPGPSTWQNHQNTLHLYPQQRMFHL